MNGLAGSQVELMFTSIRSCQTVIQGTYDVAFLLGYFLNENRATTVKYVISVLFEQSVPVAKLVTLLGDNI